MNINVSYYGSPSKTPSAANIDLTQSRRINITQDMISRQSEEEIQKNEERLATLESTLKALENGSLIPDNAPENLYAEIRVKGEVAAKIWNKGSIYIPDKFASILSAIPENSSAKERTEIIAKALGGTIHYPASQSPSYTFSQSLQTMLDSYNKTK